MADYFPLIARALDTMSDTGAPARAQVYDRARTALFKQLNALDPPLGAAELDRESRALDDAIARAEAVYGRDDESALRASAPHAENAFEDAGAADAAEIRAPSRSAPAIRPAPRRKPFALALVLTAVIVPVAIYAWVQRDRSATSPEAVVSPVVAPPTSPSNSADNKYVDRIGGAATPTAGGNPIGGTAGSSPVAAAPQRSAAPSSQADGASAQSAVTVASRAVLVEEEPATPQQPKVSSGRAVWRLDSVNGGQGQPLEAVVRAQVDFPDAGFAMTMLMRKNTDAAFPASHTIEFSFVITGDPPRVVRDVAPPQLKIDDTSRGTALSGLSVPVKDNVSLVGLSNLKGDTDRNTELLQGRNWIDVPVRFASGQRAVVSFEKGVSGDRVITDALRQWSAGQP